MPQIIPVNWCAVPCAQICDIFEGGSLGYFSRILKAHRGDDLSVRNLVGPPHLSGESPRPVEMYVGTAAPKTQNTPPPQKRGICMDTGFPAERTLEFCRRPQNWRVSISCPRNLLTRILGAPAMVQKTMSSLRVGCCRSSFQSIFCTRQTFSGHRSLFSVHATFPPFGFWCRLLMGLFCRIRGILQYFGCSVHKPVIFTCIMHNISWKFQYVRCIMHKIPGKFRQ